MNRHARASTVAESATSQLLFVAGWLMAAMIALTVAAQFG